MSQSEKPASSEQQTHDPDVLSFEDVILDEYLAHDPPHGQLDEAPLVHGKTTAIDLLDSTEWLNDPRR